MTLSVETCEATGHGVILAFNSQTTAAPVALPYVFRTSDLAQGFLSACERTGVSLFPDMGYNSMRQLFELWHDSFKRPEHLTPNA